MCAHVHYSQHLCSRSMWGSILKCFLLKLQVALLSSSPLIYTHIHISIDIDWTWSALCVIFPNWEDSPTFTLWYNEAGGRGSRAGCQVRSHSPHTAALVPVGLCHCWLVLCPLQHSCSRSGEVFPSLTGSGSKVYLTSLLQLPRDAPSYLASVHACVHLCDQECPNEICIWCLLRICLVWIHTGCLCLSGWLDD